MRRDIPTFFCQLFLMLAITLTGMMASVTATAESSPQITFFLEDEPIYTSHNPDAPGLLNELMLALTTELDLHPKTVYLPWKRAQLVTTQTANGVIFPLTRTPTREASYRWIMEILQVPVVFITRENEAAIDTTEQARKMRGLGVIMGTPQEEFLQQAGINHVSLTGETLYPSLAKGEINAVYSAAPEAVYAWRALGEKTKLVMGTPQQTLSLWVATNKASTLINDQDWNRALQKLKDSGEFDRIVARYFHPAD